MWSQLICHCRVFVCVWDAVCYTSHHVIFGLTGHLQHDKRAAAVGKQVVSVSNICLCLLAAMEGAADAVTSAVPRRRRQVSTLRPRRLFRRSAVTARATAPPTIPDLRLTTSTFSSSPAFRNLRCGASARACCRETARPRRDGARGGRGQGSEGVSSPPMRQGHVGRPAEQGPGSGSWGTQTPAFAGCAAALEKERRTRTSRVALIWKVCSGSGCEE